MSEIEVTTTLNPEIKEAAISYVKKLFSQSEDSKLIRVLKKESFKRVYKKMVLEPDEFRPKPRPAGVEPWHGNKPDGPRDFLKSKVVLPSLPQVLLQIQQVINDSGSSANDLAEVISKDPKLVASILRLANSALFSFRTEVDTPTRAVALLGFKQAGSLALATVTLSLFKRSKGTSVLEVEKFWKHSIACGVIAQEIAKAADLGDPERFFVGGMLHDIGLYVIFETSASLALEILDLAKQKGDCLYNAEQELLGFNHAILGGIIIKDWNFPHPLVVAAAGHHNPEKARNDPDAGVVHIADFISRALGYDLGGAAVLGKIEPAAWDKIGISGNFFIEKLPEIQDMIDTIFEILNPE
ncbi:HDOD domain-containing protein [Maridesulfovibrio hydrothermalis]|uniref:Metal dependent phosphohydrolase n=1 Tax=Maridesulfovibrio hydrothermalis AM13 = DSM 14728 TaxID=1121451 RepID=L0REY2_9BACT|nr:HDOD domain-containing protein [Maridesulfovibrio hydrothermalis]CCO24111.1 Metal dependent phosphohydrolase [Maridesulfovibrio hydrothermalis AM13 = DSM 14728]